MAINLPDGIESTFPNVKDGSVEGCGVYDEGSPMTAADFSIDLGSYCPGWQDEWASAAAGHDVTLVVLGAWDVFDMKIDGVVHPFGAAGHRRGVEDACEVGHRRGAGDRVEGRAPAGGLHAPVRRDGERRRCPSGATMPGSPTSTTSSGRSPTRYGTEVALVEGPPEWCNDESIATNVNYRWDGVHVYKPGAELIYDKVAPQLLQLAATP